MLWRVLATGEDVVDVSLVTSQQGRSWMEGSHVTRSAHAKCCTATLVEAEVDT
jgi:molybdenum-dependent DNA-binding transcriptional regulator ModE